MVILSLVSLASAEPDQISLSAMTDWEGIPYTNTTSINIAYEQVVKQLGAAIANTGANPANTIGIYGVELSFRNSFSFIDTKRELNNAPSPWALVTPDEEPVPILWTPEVQVRKGLPLSMEIGAKVGYLGFSKQGSFGGWFRIAPVEGYEMAPDISFQVGYAGYVGSPELGAGAMDLNMTIGKNFAFGPLTGVNSSVISPFLSAGMFTIRASPRISRDEQSQMGISAVSGFSSSDFFTEGYSPIFVAAGTTIRSSDVYFQLDYRYTIGLLSTFGVNMGLTY